MIAMRVNPKSKKPAPLTPATIKALADTKLSRTTDDEDDGYVDWGQLPSNTDRAGFNQRRIGS